MIATNITLPHSPTAADIKEVKKLTTHRVIKTQLESSGTFPIISYMTLTKSDYLLELVRSS